MVTLEKGSLLGTHRDPPGDPVYNFERFRLVGVKMARRRNWMKFQCRLEQLGRSRRGEALTATAAVVCGFFQNDVGSFPQPYSPSQEYQYYQEQNRLRPSTTCSVTLPLDLDSAFQAGRQLAKTRADLKPESVMKKFLPLNSAPSWSFLLGYFGEFFRKPNEAEKRAPEAFMAYLKTHPLSLVR